MAYQRTSKTTGMTSAAASLDAAGAHGPSRPTGTTTSSSGAGRSPSAARPAGVAHPSGGDGRGAVALPPSAQGPSGGPSPGTLDLTTSPSASRASNNPCSPPTGGRYDRYVEVVGIGLFLVVWATLFFGSMGGIILGVAALISAARTPSETFGPWWDNTKSIWLLGIAVSFLVPFGSLVGGSYWFWTGRKGLRSTGMVPRPFWTGPPKPQPPYPPAAWSPSPPPPGAQPDR
jgi:hypothetical protein